MKLDKFQIIEIGGIISVVISLLFVAYQIQQANIIARVSTELELKANRADFNQEVYGNTEAAELFQMTFTNIDPQHVTAADRARLFAFAERWIEMWSAAEIAYEAGMLSEASYQISFDQMRIAVNANPGLRQTYRIVLDSFSSYRNSNIGQQLDLLLKEHGE